MRDHRSGESSGELVRAVLAGESANSADVYCADCGDGVEGRDGGLCGVCAMLLKEQKEAAEAALNEAAELLSMNLDCPADWRHIEVPCPKIGKLSGHELCVACWRKWLREKAAKTALEKAEKAEIAEGDGDVRISD